MYICAHAYMDIWIYVPHGYMCHMDIEDLIICLVGYIVLTSGRIRFPHDFRTVSIGFRMISNDFPNSDRQAASVTHFGSHFAHLNSILESLGGAGSSKVLVSYEKGIKIPSSHFLHHFALG